MKKALIILNPQAGTKQANKYFVEMMNKYFYFDSEFMLKYKIETKDIIKNFYLNGDIVCSYEDITYK